MEAKTIQSWIGKSVRIKREYIKTELEIDEDASTYDDDGNIVEEVFYERTYIDIPNGLQNVYSGRSSDIFNVRYDCYGVDLYKVRNIVDVDTLPEPTHQIIIGEQGDYPFMWDAKYFEVVT